MKLSKAQRLTPSKAWKIIRGVDARIDALSIDDPKFHERLNALVAEKQDAVSYLRQAGRAALDGGK